MLVVPTLWCGWKDEFGSGKTTVWGFKVKKKKRISTFDLIVMVNNGCVRVVRVKLTMVVWLALPPKMDGGNIFTPVCLVVCLSVNRISQKVVDRVRWNCGQVGCVTRTNWFDFGEDLDPDIRIFQVILHHWEIGWKNGIYHDTVFQKVVHGFGRDLVKRLGVCRGWNDYILVRIRIHKIGFEKLFFTIERSDRVMDCIGGNSIN